PRLIRIRQRRGGNGDTAYALVTRSDDTALMGIPHDPLSLLGECRKVVWIYRGGEEYLAGAFPCVKQRDGHPGFVGKVVSWGNNGSSPARQLVGSFTVIPCPGNTFRVGMCKQKAGLKGGNRTVVFFYS